MAAVVVAAVVVRTPVVPDRNVRISKYQTKVLFVDLLWTCCGWSWRIHFSIRYWKMEVLSGVLKIWLKTATSYISPHRARMHLRWIGVQAALCQQVQELDCNYYQVSAGSNQHIIRNSCSPHQKFHWTKDFHSQTERFHNHLQLPTAWKEILFLFRHTV